MRRPRLRLRLVALLALALAAASCGPKSGRSTTPVQPLTPAQIAERALPSVVLIKFPEALGTGFVVWKDGRIATNLHVLVMGDPRALVVVLPDGREFQGRQVELMAADPEHDLAIIRVPVRDMKALALADSSKVKPGEAVVAIGHPLGLGSTVSNGLMSGVRNLDEEHTLLQISAPISPGSSGGPLFNDRGEVIGVATLYASEGQNLNFAVPSNNLKPLLLKEKGLPIDQLRDAISETFFGTCPIAEVAVAYRSITDAIAVGVPTFNSGDHAGCYRIYAEAAKQLVDNLPHCTGMKQLLTTGLTEAANSQNPTDSAWAMRHVFDALLHRFATILGSE